MEGGTELQTLERWVQATTKPVGRNLRGQGDDFTTCGDLALDHTVARILLDTAQSRLPDWGYVAASGEVVQTRRRRPVQARPVQLLPQLLFSINWCDSGPGFSWPESYFVTYVPRLNVRVVTASSDSDELWGYTDLAIGCCPAVRSPDWGTKKIIIEWWRRSSSADVGPWQDFLSAGLVGEERARQWRTEVWGSREPWDYS